MRVILSPAAAKDIEEIGHYIYLENPSAADRFVEALRARCARIAEAPRGGAPRPALWPGLRSVTFRRYVIFYTVVDEVRVERVLHGARDIAAIFADEGN